MLLLDSILHLLLAWYIDQVHPGDTGVGRSLCFCFEVRNYLSLWGSRYCRLLSVYDYETLPFFFPEYRIYLMFHHEMLPISVYI